MLYTWIFWPKILENIKTPFWRFGDFWKILKPPQTKIWDFELKGGGFNIIPPVARCRPEGRRKVLKHQIGWKEISIFQWIHRWSFLGGSNRSDLPQVPPPVCGAHQRCGAGPSTSKLYLQNFPNSDKQYFFELDKKYFVFFLLEFWVLVRISL